MSISHCVNNHIPAHRLNFLYLNCEDEQIKSYDFVSASVTTLSGFSNTGGPLCKYEGVVSLDL